MHAGASSSTCPALPHADLDHVLEHTREIWEAMRGQRLFISGGTGFFGVWLLESFALANDQLGLGAEAVVLTRNPSHFIQRFPHLAGRAGLTLHQGDVREFTFPAGAFQFVIHAATTAAFAVDPLDNFSVIVDGTRRVLDFARAAGCSRFLLTSSGAIYGRQPSELTHVPETYLGGPDPLSPASTYAEAKRAAEHLCTLYQQRYELAATVARCFAFVGPHLPLDQHFAIGNFLRDRLQSRKIAVQGDGTAFRSYLYAADLAIWLWTILLRGTSGRAYNVGSDDSISIAQLAARLGEVSIAQTPGGAPPARYVPDISRARQELGLQPLIGLDEAIQRTIAWLQQ